MSIVVTSTTNTIKAVFTEDKKLVTSIKPLSAICYIELRNKELKGSYVAIGFKCSDEWVFDNDDNRADTLTGVNGQAPTDNQDILSKLEVLIP